jgi:ATP-dependent RNA helicase DDX3X
VFLGRTGRIGHKGLATSFYNERDEGLAPLLVLTLLETGQEVPDFLQQFVPEGIDRANIKFEDNTDEEIEKEKEGGNGGGGGDGWGDSTALGGTNDGSWGGNAADTIGGSGDAPGGW